MTRQGVPIRPIYHPICKKNIYVDRILPESFLNEGHDLVMLECSLVNIGAAQLSYFPETILNVSIISPRRRL